MPLRPDMLVTSRLREDGSGRSEPIHARAMGSGKEVIWAEMEARAGKGRPSQEHP